MDKAALMISENVETLGKTIESLSEAHDNEVNSVWSVIDKIGQ